MKLERVRDKKGRIRTDYPEWMRIDPKSGTYYCDLYRRERTPSRLRKSSGEKSLDRSKQILEHEISKWLGEDVTTGGPVHYKFSQSADELLIDMQERTKLPIGHKRRIKQSTLSNARRYIAKLKEEFGVMYVNRISCHEKTGHWIQFVKRYHAERDDELIRRELDPTVKVRGEKLYSYWKHMNLVMFHSIGAGHRTEIWKTEDPDPEAEEGRRLSQEEKASLIQAASVGTKDEIVMAMTMGLRLREILRQAWQYCDESCCASSRDFCHVDLNAKTLSVCRAHGKHRNSARTIALSPQGYAVLMARWHHRDQRSPFVFPSRENPMKAKNENKTAWKATKRRAKIVGKLKFHHLRHTFLSECAGMVREGQVSTAQVCKYAGLTQKVFESVYLHMGHKETEAVSKMIVIKLPELENRLELVH